jgi:hypothetical protein
MPLENPPIGNLRDLLFKNLLFLFIRSHDTPVVDADAKPLYRASRLPAAFHPPAPQPM